MRVRESRCSESSYSESNYTVLEAANKNLPYSVFYVYGSVHRWIYINNCPTRCNTKQSIYYSASSLYMFQVPTTPIIRSTQNCNYSLRYWSYFLCSCFPSTWPSLAKLEGGRWVWLAPETCRVNLQNNK